LRRLLTLFMSVGAPSSRHVLSTPRRRFPMNGRRTAPCPLEPDAVATPGRDVRAHSFMAGFRVVFLEGPRTSPRRAVMLCTERVSCLVSSVLAFAPSCFVR
jgi:hypothetical protein